MNKNLVLTALIGSLLLAGCNSGSKKSGEDIQKKIDEAGWKIVEPNGGTISENVNLEISSGDKLSVVHDKEKNEISKVAFKSELSDGEFRVFQNSDSGEDAGDDIGSIDTSDGKSTCTLYNITKNKENDEPLNTYKECKEQDLNKLKELIKVRDETLKEYDLTVDDLFAWGEWYYDKK